MNRTDANAGLIVKLSLKLADGSEYKFDGEDGRPYSNDIFGSFSVTLTGISASSWRGTLTLVDTTGAAEEAILLIGTGLEFVVDFTYADDATRHPVYSGTVLDIRYQLRDEGVSLVIDLCNSNLINSLTRRIVKTWKEGTKPHDIFLDLASVCGWSTYDSGVSVVYPKSKPIDVPLTYDSKQMSAEQWVTDKLLKYSVSEEGLRYVAFPSPPRNGDRQSAVHFHPAEWSPARNTVDAKPMETYEYRRGDGVVLSVNIDDTSFSAAVLGAFNMETAGIDSLNGVVLSSLIRDSNEANKPLPSDAANLPKHKMTPVARYMYIASRYGSALSSKIAHKVSQLADSSFNLDMSMIGTHALYPCDCFNFIYTTNAGVRHFVSGTYRVFSVAHSVSMGGWVTTVEAYRSSMGEGGPYADKPAETAAAPTTAAKPAATNPVRTLNNTPTPTISSAATSEPISLPVTVPNGWSTGSPAPTNLFSGLYGSP